MEITREPNKESPIYCYSIYTIDTQSMLILNNLLKYPCVVHASTSCLLQLKDLRVGQWIEPCIGLTQENLIENSVQDSLSYILNPHGLC